jgi:hypothetical protein
MPRPYTEETKMDVDWQSIEWFMAGMGAGFVLGWVTAWLTVLRHHTSSSSQSSTGDQT